MSLEEFTVDKNTAHVEQAHVEMGVGQVDEIERKAKAQVTTAKEESGRVAQEESRVAGAANGSESKLYGDIAAEASGLKVISTVADFLGDSKSPDSAKTLGGLAPASARNIEDDIMSANRKPGIYRAPVSASTYGSTDLDAGGKMPMQLSKRAGNDLIERSNITETSLRDQGKDTVSTWAGTDQKLGSVQEAKKITFGQELSSEQALESVQNVRAQHSAHMGQAQMLSPGMGMGSGPSIRPTELMSEARDNYIDQTSAAGA